MKNIIVAMDFSKGAENALEFAILVANRMKSDIQLVWVDTSSTKEIAYGPCKNEVRRDAKLELQRIVDENSNKLISGKMSMKLRKGKVYQELALVAKSLESALVVVGTHGISGFEEFWIGSNAFKIISYAPCPVISVRVNYDVNRPIKTIIVPIDNSSDSTKKIPMAANLAIAFEAEIHLLGIYTTKLSSLRKKTDRALLESEKYLIKEKVKYNRQSVSSSNLPLTVVNYAENLKADMIVIMTDQEKASHSFLLGDYSQKIINLSTLPILSVKPLNLFD